MFRGRNWLLVVLGGIGLILWGLSVWEIRSASAGLQEIHLKAEGLPVTVLAPEGVELASRPLVLIGHGFAGSEVIMRGFALTLAHAGYVAASWDFEGHGANPRGMAADNLLQNPERALEELMARGWADARRVAIVGHSMGSGVALNFGLNRPETAATVAISPTRADVTPSLPRNLLLLAGQREARFVQNAEMLLEMAGGPGGNPAQGSARQMQVIPHVEHLSILFSPTAHRATRDWLDATFDVQPAAKDYRDRRVLWYALGVLGALLLGLAIASWISDAPAQGVRQTAVGRSAVAMIVGALGAALILHLAGKLGLELINAMGLLVGGYLLLWFGLAGIIGLLLSGVKWTKPTWRSMLTGVILWGILWLGVGLLGNSVWLKWLLIPKRLALWPVGSVLLMPWVLLIGGAICPASPLGKLGWWAVQSTILIGGLSLALTLNSGLFFLTLILPVFPVIMGLHVFVTGACRDRWSFAISGAFFISWLLLAVFPMQ